MQKNEYCLGILNNSEMKTAAVLGIVRFKVTSAAHHFHFAIVSGSGIFRIARYSILYIALYSIAMPIALYCKVSDPMYYDVRYSILCITL